MVYVKTAPVHFLVFIDPRPPLATALCSRLSRISPSNKSVSPPTFSVEIKRKQKRWNSCFKIQCPAMHFKLAEMHEDQTTTILVITVNFCRLYLCLLRWSPRSLVRDNSLVLLHFRSIFCDIKFIKNLWQFLSTLSPQGKYYFKHFVLCLIQTFLFQHAPWPCLLSSTQSVRFTHTGELLNFNKKNPESSPDADVNS